MMRAGSLFSGIEGLGLGLESAGLCETVWLFEIDPSASQVLDRHYPGVPNLGDITAVDWTQVEPVDVLHGGFPCQDISQAGRGAGIKEGTRSGLWFEFAAAIRVLRPRIVIVENVPMLAARGLDIVLGDLAEAGFDAWWSTLRASDVGAAHRRERIFIVAVAADSDRLGRLHGQAGELAAEAGVDALGDAPAGRGAVTADGDGGRRSQRREQGGGSQQPGLEASRRHDAGGRDQAPADADVAGPQGQRRPRQQGPQDVVAGRGVRTAPADAPLVGRPEGRPEPDGRRVATIHAADWGEWASAIRRWEHILGRPAPRPVDDQGRLSADFVTWHMGFPEGWVDDLPRAKALACLGNAVVPQVAERVGRWALAILDRLDREVAA